MTRDRFPRTTLAVLAAAWLMAVPAFYLLYDYWMRGLDPSLVRRELLRPYAFFVGICPLVLFWAGNVFAALCAAGAGRQSPRQPTSTRWRALNLVLLVVGALGSVIGTATAVPVLAVTLLALSRGEVPLGLLALVGGLSAAAIWLGRYALRQLDRGALRTR